MRLLAAVIMFAIASCVFAADETWEIDKTHPSFPYTQKREPVSVHETDKGAHPEVGTTGNQDCACNPLPFTSPEPSPQGCRPVPATANEEKKEELLILNAANAIQCKLVRVGVGLGISQLLLAMLTVLYAGMSVRVTDRGLKVSERAYLLVENWHVHGLRGNEPPRITCSLVNTGRTPAILAAYEVRAAIKPDLPPAPQYKKLPQTDFEQNVVAAERNLTINIPITRDDGLLPAIVEEALKMKKALLHVHGCFAYKDVFGLPHRVAFFARYDPIQQIFMIVNKSGYNYST